jgi:hypothetical protein
MSDSSDEYRRAAGECVAMARTTTDPVTRIKLLTMAQRWYDMANGPHINLDILLRHFNDEQMARH